MDIDEQIDSSDEEPEDLDGPEDVEGQDDIGSEDSSPESEGFDIYDLEE